MKKEFELSAKLNTADFDRSISEMVKKLKDIQQPIGNMQQNTGQRLQQQGFGGISSTSMEAFQKSTQGARREMDQLISEQAKGQEKLGKFIAQRTESIKQLLKEQKSLVQGSKEELEIREKISRAEANQQQLKEQYRQRDSNLNQLLDAKETMKPQGIERLMDAYKGGGVGGAATAAGRMASQNPIGALSFGAGAVGAVAGGIGALGSYAERFTGYGQRLQEARGSAIENTAGQNLRDVYSGRSPFESAFTDERAAAAGMAKQKEERNRVTDRMKGIGSIGSMIGGAGLMVGGAAVGAASILGTPFTAGGSALGLPVAAGMIGAGAAAFGGGAYGMTNDRTRQSINPLGQKEYDQMLSKDQAVDFRKTYEDLKNQNPGKKLALEDFEQNRNRNVQSQRTLGLSNNGFYGEGGFLNNVQQGGFMGEQGIGMANSIVAAGGSSRMGTQARFGLEMERSGLTNASSILGATSGSIQNPEANKRATISIMSEAFKIGLDSTNFAEENRKFTQAAANVIGRTGVTSENDQDRLSATLAQFMGEKTNAGVGAAQSAYEKSQERGSQTSGRRGALRFQAAMKDKDLSKMSTSDLTEMLSMRPEEMNASNPAMAEFARSAGISVDQLVDKMTGKGGVNDAGRLLFPGQKDKIGDASSKLNKYMADNGLSYSDLGDKARKGELPSEIQQALGRTMIENNKGEQGGLTTSEGIAQAGEFVQGAPRGVNSNSGKENAESQLKGSGRLEDLFTQKAAEGAEEARKNFSGMTEELYKAAAGAKAFIQAVAPLAGTLNTSAGQTNRSLPQGNAFNTDISLTAGGAQQQTQANKPKGN